MSVQLYMKRIQNANRAMVRAQNPWFRSYWNKVALALQDEMIRIHG